MEPFNWQAAQSLPQAAALARQTVAHAMLATSAAADRVVLKAGGIDLLDLMKEGLLHPVGLVDLRQLPGIGVISGDADGVRIGAMATLEQISAHPMLRQHYTALADAAGRSASPQIRHVATLGGNLLQRPRCWYFRSAAHHCSRKGGDHCFAFTGENQYHAIFGQMGCAIVHPSTAATALLAFDARVELLSAANGTRIVPMSSFLVGPEVDITRETDLHAGEVLTAVLLPSVPATTRSVFLKQAQRSFDWSIGDVAVVLDHTADGVCRRASVVLGAAAPVPWRASQAEAALVGKVIDPTVAEAAGQAAVAKAMPLGHNGYKLPVLATLVSRAVLHAAGVAEPADVQ